MVSHRDESNAPDKWDMVTTFAAQPCLSTSVFCMREGKQPCRRQRSQSAGLWPLKDDTKLRGGDSHLPMQLEIWSFFHQDR